ncbi:MAG: sugar transporter [Pedobacter sp.]|nr:MAG: sugar transporter [Pedobacter sp.]
MKLVKILCFLTVITFSGYGQILKPVTWSYVAKKTSPTTATIFLKANVEEGWHLYSQFVKPGGPVKTTFTFAKDKAYSLIGNTIEPKPIQKFEPMFQMTISYFSGPVIFQQKVKFTGKNPVVKGKVEYMVCDDSQCLPPEEVEFSIAIK